MLTPKSISEISFIAQLGDLIDGQVDKAWCHASVNLNWSENLNSMAICVYIHQQANDGKGGTEKALATIVRCLHDINSRIIVESTRVLLLRTSVMPAWSIEFHILCEHAFEGESDGHEASLAQLGWEPWAVQFWGRCICVFRAFFLLKHTLCHFFVFLKHTLCQDQGGALTHLHISFHILGLCACVHIVYVYLACTYCHMHNCLGWFGYITPQHKQTLSSPDMQTQPPPPSIQLPADKVSLFKPNLYYSWTPHPQWRCICINP